MTPFAIATAPRRNSRHWQAGSVTWEEICGWATTPASVKESGNYLLGTLLPSTTVTHPGDNHTCTNRHRRKDFVVSRSAITLDVDFARPDFPDRADLLIPSAYLIHTTFQSTPEAPRYRIIIPTDREMAPDEYVAAAETLMQQLGHDEFDPGTSQPERYMFRPAAEVRANYWHHVADGPLLAVDDLIADFEEDLSRRPVPRPSRNKRDPFALEGVIGAFNRAYRDAWDELIDVYDLPYDKVSEGRYQLRGARAAAGMGPIPEAEGLVFSHHSNDPAGERACSAFDLVRLHVFGDLDEDLPPGTPVNRMPSQDAMRNLAAQDHRVIRELVGADFDDQMGVEDDESSPDWRDALRFSPRTLQLEDTITNWDLIVENDPLFGLLCYNERSMAVEFTAPPPWRKITDHTRIVTEPDRANYAFAIERTYRYRPSRALLDALIDTKALQTVINPIRDYLESLRWDGIARVETCLPGVRPTPYTRLVARKALVAAVARMLNPGCKWDHTLVLYGPEGLGKTWWIERVARGSASTLGPITHKDTLLAMQQSWILISDEGHALKGDSNPMKEFLTRREDVFRAPYDREVRPHPRSCVIWATTNQEEFLRRQEGNRRFMIVHCESKVDFDAITDDYVDQLWAEAAALYRSGERLYFDDLEAVEAAAEREPFMEEDALFGQILEYVDTPVPEEWNRMWPEARVQWLHDYRLGFVPEGPARIDEVCSAQIWIEALDRRKGDHRREDLLEITEALKRMPGWHKLHGRQRVLGYGTQLVFARQPANEDPPDADHG